MRDSLDRTFRNPRFQRLALFLLLVVISLSLRIFDLDKCAHADSVTWVARSRRFWEALAEGRWSDTYQSPHPGVLTMWLSGASMKLFGAYHPQSALHLQLAAASAPIAVVGALLGPFSYLLLRRVLPIDDHATAWTTGMLISTGSKLVTNSRWVHVDGLGTSLAFLAILALGLAAKNGRFRVWIAAGILCGLAVLARSSVGPIIFLAGVAILLAYAWSRFRKHRLFLGIGAATLVAVATCIALWPALWEFSLGTVERQVETSHRWATQSGHRRGSMYYFWNFYGRHSPIILVALIPGFIGMLARPRHRAWTLWMLAAYAGFTCVILQAPKTLSRYLLPLEPMAYLIASYGIVGSLRSAQWLIQRWWIPRRRLIAQLGTVILLGLTGYRWHQTAELQPCAILCWTDRCSVAMQAMPRQIAGEFMRRENLREKVRIWSPSSQPLLRIWQPWRRSNFQRADYVILNDRHAQGSWRRIRADIRAQLERQPRLLVVKPFRRKRLVLYPGPNHPRWREPSDSVE